MHEVFFGGVTGVCRSDRDPNADSEFASYLGGKTLRNIIELIDTRYSHDSAVYEFVAMFVFSPDVTRYAIKPLFNGSHYRCEIFLTLTPEQMGEWMRVKAELAY